MWDFMKKPPPINKVCVHPPVYEVKQDVLNLEQKIHSEMVKLNQKIDYQPNEIKREIQAYKRLILGELDVVYKKILQELSVTDRESLATLHEVIAEYKEIVLTIDEKINLMETTLQSWNEIHKPTLKQEYNAAARELTLSVEVS